MIIPKKGMAIRRPQRSCDWQGCFASTRRRWLLCHPHYTYPENVLIEGGGVAVPPMVRWQWQTRRGDVWAIGNVEELEVSPPHYIVRIGIARTAWLCLRQWLSLCRTTRGIDPLTGYWWRRLLRCVRNHLRLAIKRSLPWI